MSAADVAAPGPVSPPSSRGHEPKDGMSTKTKLLLFGGVWLGGVVVLIAIYGFHGTRNKAYEPQNEFKLENWVNLGAFSINKAVLYLFLAAALTTATMIYIARRMQQRPNRVQAAIEALYTLMRSNITGSAMDEQMAAKWFPFIATLFLFILFSNLIGYLPLPTNTEHEITVFGLHDPLVLALRGDRQHLDPARAGAGGVRLLHVRRGPREGPDRLPQGPRPGRRHRRHGRVHLLPRGPLQPDAPPLAHDPSVRQHPRRPPDHPVHGGRARRAARRRPALGWLTIPFGILLFVFEVGLVAALQAFIFATLTAIYLGGAVAVEH